jgi:ribose transport system substrate-binding protein
MDRTKGLAVACVLGLSLAACGGQASSDRSGNLASVIKPLDNPFFAAMRDGLRAAAKQHGVGITVHAAMSLQDTAGQAAALESLAADNAACYLVNPIDETNLTLSLGDIARGTPIVNIDSPVDPAAAEAVGARITTYIGTDNVAAGQMAADAMADQVDNGARVAVIAGIPGDAGSNARTRGFIEGARGRFKVVSTTAADFDRSQAHQAALDLIGATGQLDGIFAVNDEMALGAAEAVGTAGRDGKVAVIGMDGIPEALAAVRRGDMSATVAQYPFTMGQLGVEACLAAIRGKQVPATIRPPIQLVTGQNVERAQLTLPRPAEHFDDPVAPLLGS